MHNGKIQVISAYLAQHPPHWLKTSNPRGKGNSRKGIIYEKQAHEYLYDMYNGFYANNTWIVYKTFSNGPKWCQPDGLHFDFFGGVITIFEMKLRHNSKAYRQLVNLYTPVIEKVFPQWRIRTIEMCSWYDREVRTPRKPVLVSDLDKAKVDDYSLHIWRKN